MKKAALSLIILDENPKVFEILILYLKKDRLD